MSEICMVQGTTSPARVFTLQDGAGAAVNIGGNPVVLHLVGLDVAYSATRSAVKVDAENGVVRFDPIAADTAAPGLYRLEFEVVYEDSTNEIFPVEGAIWMEVRPRA